MDSLFITHAALSILLMASILTLLITCPSRSKMWGALKHFAADHEAANQIIDQRRQARRDLEFLPVFSAQRPQSCGEPLRGPNRGERKGRLFA